MTIPSRDIFDLDELIALFREGEASTNDIELLGSALAGEDSARDQFLRHMYLAAMLKDVALSGLLIDQQSSDRHVSLSDRIPRRRLKAGSRRILTWLAVIVVIVSSIGIWWSFRAPSQPVIARLTQVQGSVEIRSAGQRIAAMSGSEIRSGETVHTQLDELPSMGDSSVVVAYEDGTQVALVGNSSVTFVDGTHKKLTIHQGVISAAVTSQANPMLIRTPSAELRVLSPKLTLQTDAHRTDVNVIEGRVEVTGSSGGRSAVVPSGKRTVASHNAVLRIQKTPAPSHRWQEDFEQGVPDYWHAQVVTDSLPSGSRGAAKAKFSENHGGRYSLGCRETSLNGLFAITETTHLHITFKLERREWLNVFIGVRRLDPGSATPSFYRTYKNMDISAHLPAAGQWRTITIPLSRFHSADIVDEGDIWAGPSPQPDVTPIWFGISSTKPDRGLVVDRVWVTPDGPGEVVVNDNIPNDER